MTQDYSQYPRHLVAVDCIIFGFDGENLKILLVERNFEPKMGEWSLMGGFIGDNETSDEAAQRVLNTLTGLENIYLEQLNCYTEIHREPTARIMSISYYALINIEKNGDFAVVHSAIDNLLKGASGQAIHNMNISFGFPENAGLKLKSIAF